MPGTLTEPTFVHSCQQSAEWKAKYVRLWVPTSGVWGGAGSGIKQLISGDSESIPGVTGSTVKEEQRSYESSMLLAPTPQVWADFPLVRTPGRNFTASDYSDLFPLANFSDGFARWSLLSNLTSNLVAPGVNTTHLFGRNVATPTAFSYDGVTATDFSKEPKTLTGDGDGTVPLLSLSASDSWGNSGSGWSYSSQAFDGLNHEGILRDAGYIKRVLAIVSLS